MSPFSGGGFWLRRERGGLRQITLFGVKGVSLRFPPRLEGRHAQSAACLGCREVARARGEAPHSAVVAEWEVEAPPHKCPPLGPPFRGAGWEVRVPKGEARVHRLVEARRYICPSTKNARGVRVESPLVGFVGGGLGVTPKRCSQASRRGSLVVPLGKSSHSQPPAGPGSK